MTIERGSDGCRTASAVRPGPAGVGLLAVLLPQGTADYVAELLDRDDLAVSLSRPRRTKFGDHRPPGRGFARHRITLNVDLNPYALLTTLLHEVAHAHVWDRHRHRRRVRPHGPEWQAEFTDVLGPVIRSGALPRDLQMALTATAERPAAATCTDRRLLLALSKYDPMHPQRVFVEALPAGAIFRIDDGTLFRAGPMLRTRRRCFECRSGREYRVHGLMRVAPVPDEPIAQPHAS
jgi:SprT protein